MTAPNTDKTIIASTAEVTSKKLSRWPLWLSLLSLVLTVAAWISGNFNGICAITLSAAAIITGAFALRSHNGAVRNTAITSIIAAAVLLVVVSAFMIVVYMGLKSI